MAKKYTIPFKSLAGKTCRIDIYDSTYSGSTVTTLKGAAQPVVIQEEDDESLLTVLRAKTGYISVVEETFGALAGLYPETNTQLMVQIYYDGDLVFYGYIQAQAFENQYEAAPRVLQLPIMSPLALMEGWKFGDDTGNSDHMIGAYLDECLSLYEDIILPRDLLSSAETGTETPLQMMVNNRTVCPWNNDYDYGLRTDGTDPSPYDPITYQDFLEGFCHLYGLIAHECGKTLVFQKVDYTGQYVKMDVGDLQEDTMDADGMPTGATVLAFESVFTPSGQNSREGLVLPLEKLTYDYGEYRENVPMDLSRSKYVGRVALSDYDFNGTVLNPQTNEFYSQFFTTALGTLSNTNHVRVVGDGTEEQVEVNVAIAAGQSNDVELFRYNFSDVPINISGAKFETSFGHESGQSAVTLRMQVMSGGKYYDENHDWVSQPAFLPLTFDENGNCTTYDVASNSRNVTIKIFPPAGSGAAVKGMFNSITLETFADPLRKYEIPIDTKKVVKNSVPSYTDATIDMLMHTACGNSRRLNGGWIARDTYAYLFKSQLRHKRQVKKATATDMTLAYLKKTTSTAAAGTWRIIAMNFDPWNDDYEITMHRTSTT